MKKKILTLFIVVFLLISPLYGENDEIAVVLPNGDVAYDNFSGSTIDDKWHTSSSWFQNNGFYNNYSNKNTYAYQAYNFNVGVLKSDYYRFKTKVYAGNNSYWSGFAISDQAMSNPDLKISVVKSKTFNYGNKRNQLTLKMGNATQVMNLTKNFNAYYYFEIILNRVNDSNKFNVEIKVYDTSNNLLGSRSANNVTLDAIYPTFWVKKDKWGDYYEYNAYIKPNLSDVTFSKLHQNGDQIEFDYLEESDDYDSVELFYSTDEDVTTDGSDMKISFDSSKKFTITEAMKNGGYFGVVGKSGSSYGPIDKRPFNYLNTPTNFYYVPTGTEKKYKYTWDAVPGATSYRLVYQGSTTEYVYTSNTTITNTQFDITDPTKMSIIAKGPSAIVGNDHVSESVSAVEGTLSPVDNFTGAIVKRIVDDEEKYFVDFSWNTYDGASEYIIVRNNGLGDYSVIADGLTSTVYSDLLSSQFIALNYKIKAVVSGKYSAYTDALTIKNKVKNVIYNFNDTDHVVNIFWEPISEATSYKVYVSKNPDMSSAEVYTVNVADDENTQDIVSYAYPFEVDDDANRYVQIEAWKDSVSSDKTDIITVDFSRNNIVKNLKYEYTPNTYQVKVSWDALEGATNYAVWVGTSPTDLTLIKTVPTLDYIYNIQNSDPNTLYMAVQGIDAGGSFIKSNPLVISTFIKDSVTSLSANLENGTATLRWNSLFRADGYQVYKNNVLVNTSEITSTTYTLTNASENDTVKIRGIMKNGENTYYSQFSNTVTLVKSSNDINISASDENAFSKKIYGSPMDLELDILNNLPSSELYDVEVKIILKNLYTVDGGNINPIMSYVFPEIQWVTVAGNDVGYVTDIISERIVEGSNAGDAGYTVVISLVNNDNNITTGKTLNIGLKTDLRFDSSVAIPGNKQELPFNITDVISTLENTYGADYFANNTNLEAIISYKLSPSSDEIHTKAQIIDFNFEKKKRYQVE